MITLTGSKGCRENVQRLVEFTIQFGNLFHTAAASLIIRSSKIRSSKIRSPMLKHQKYIDMLQYLLCLVHFPNSAVGDFTVKKILLLSNTKFFYN